MNILRLVDNFLNIESKEEIKNNTNKEFSTYCIERNKEVKEMNELMNMFNERVYDILPEYFNEIEHEKNNHENFKKKYFSPLDRNSIVSIESEEEYRDDIRELKDFCTDLVNYQIFSHTGAFSFMYIVDKIHKIVLDLYKEKKNLNKLDILFVYKGGNLLKNIKDMFFTKLPGDASETINKKYTAFFAKSDLDYSIYINPKLDNYDVIFNDICNLAYKIQMALKQVFMSNPYIYFHWFKFNDSYRTYVLDYYHKKASSSLKSLIDPHNSRIYNHAITGILFNDISSLGKNDKRTYTQKPNQYIFKSSEGNKVHKYDVYTPLFSPIYVSFNDSIEFKAPERLLLTKFNLVRTKFNFNIYSKKRITFEEEENQKGTEKLHEVGGELIDVSITHKDDADVNHFFDDIYANISTISYYEPPSGFMFKNEEESYNQYTYSLNYMYYDLHKIIFKLYNYPWDDRKYKKRLYRLFFISLIDYYAGESQEIKDMEGINTRVHNIYDYFIKVLNLLYNDDNSIINCLKYAQRKKHLSSSVSKLSSELKRINEVFDLKKYTNKNLITVLKDSIIVLEKVLVKHNLYKSETTSKSETPAKPEENTIETLERLESFMNDIIDNIEVIIKTIEQTKEFCLSKSINLDLLKEFKFAGY